MGARQIPILNCDAKNCVRAWFWTLPSPRAPKTIMDVVQLARNEGWAVRTISRGRKQRSVSRAYCYEHRHSMPSQRIRAQRKEERAET